MTYITVKYLFSGVSRGNRYFLQRIHFFPELPLLLRQSEGHSARHLRQHTGDGPAGGDWSSRWVKVPILFSLSIKPSIYDEYYIIF